MKMRILLLVLFILSSVYSYCQDSKECIIHPIDSLSETEAFTIYKADTFNLHDHNGLIQGKGIWVLKDSYEIRSMASYTMGPDASGISRCRGVDGGPLEVWYHLHRVYYGQFKDNMKTGIWKCNTDDMQMELTMINDNIQGPLHVYYPNGKAMYSGNVAAGKDKVELKHYSMGGLLLETISYPLDLLVEFF
ncbi:MAG: hypothetical protein JWO03_77 [Bacteroidetes bacterium]|nr:hypothetical protein [Bacteroidota bacterium]